MLSSCCAGWGRWVGEVQVPAEAAVVDWVLSDSSQRHWDNNRLVDFHSRVQDALTTDQLAQVEHGHLVSHYVLTRGGAASEAAVACQALVME